MLRALVEGLERAIPESLVGVYLQGSFALEAADEDSDVDFVVVIRRPLWPDDVDRLQGLHGEVHEQASPWARGLEGSYVPTEVLGSLERRGERLWYLDNGARHLIESTHCNTAVVRHILREQGVVLAGPDPGTLLDVVPTGVLREEMLATMRSFGREIETNPARFGNRFYQGFIVLSFSRMWCDFVMGEPGSKERGAAWAQERLPASWADLIDRAWATRTDPATSVRSAADPADFHRTLELVRLVTARCEEVASGVPTHASPT